MKNKDPLFQAAIIELIAHPIEYLRALGLHAAKDGSFDWLYIERMDDGGMGRGSTQISITVGPKGGNELFALDWPLVPKAVDYMIEHVERGKFCPPKRKPRAPSKKPSR